MSTENGIRLTDSFVQVLERLRRGDSLFLTGKAGTGKSTLLEMARRDAIERDLVVATTASTGVAALNVQGETIHRFFGFRANLEPTLREYRAPERLIDLDFLIIDEVSMVRADLMDMVNTALQRVKKSRAPFGGIQVLLVGDLYQLPPVVTGREEIHELFGYSSPFFFSSNVISEMELSTVELPDIFRQSDSNFIGILNAIRQGQASKNDLASLNDRVVDEVDSPIYSDYITLTGSNRKADELNRRRLAELGNEIFVSRATRKGEIDEKLFKAEEELEFAIGSRVMMLVNTEQFVNGSLGVIRDVFSDEEGRFVVAVELDGSSELVEVKRYKWDISRAVRQGKTIVYEEVGAFEQLPFRLAWAVTIHKSQGKTFDRVIFDRDRGMFADGQMYVALSRCRSLEGLVLAREVTERDVRVSPEVINFFAAASAKKTDFDLGGSAFVATIETGGGEFSKLVEIAITWQGSSGEELFFSSLVNPNRDLGDARIAGLEASDLTLAPSVSNIQALVSKILAGKYIVSSSLSNFMKLMGWSDLANSVVGLDLSKKDQSTASEPAASALERVNTIRERFLDLKSKYAAGMPFPDLGLTISEGDYVLRRITDSDPDLIALASGIELDDIERERFFSAFVRSQPVAESATGSGLRDSNVAVFNALVEASHRDGRMSESEKQQILDYANGRNLEVPVEMNTQSTTSVQLESGLRVCLTGTAPRTDSESIRSKDSLRKVLKEAGLNEVNSVTKSNCDLVVAYNESSMSGKAKKAREYGIPVVGSEAFLDMVRKYIGE